MYSGAVTSITPAAIKAGLPIKQIIDWWAATDDPWQVIFGWHMKIKVELNGLIGEQSYHVIGRSVQPINDMELLIEPDVMPNYDLSGYVSVECRDGVPTPEIVYYQPITIKVLGGGDGGDGEPPSGELPLIPIALGAGVLLVAVAALTKRRK